MKLRNLASVTVISLLISTSSYATVLLSGTALKGVTGSVVGQKAVYVVDNNNIGFGSLNLIEGTSITSSSAFGENFTVVGSVTSSSFGTVNFGSPSGFALGNGVDTGDHFAIIVFTTSTGNALGNDTYKIWTDSTWLIPADTNTVTFGTNLKQFTSVDSPAFTKTVATTAIPEPSTYAAAVGFIILGLAAFKRRKLA